MSRLSNNKSHWKLSGDHGTDLYSFRALKGNNNRLIIFPFWGDTVADKHTVLDSWILLWITSYFKEIKVHNQLATQYLSKSFKTQKNKQKKTNPKANELTVTGLWLLSNLGRGIYQGEASCLCPRARLGWQSNSCNCSSCLLFAALAVITASVAFRDSAQATLLPLAVYHSRQPYLCLELAQH